MADILVKLLLIMVVLIAFGASGFILRKTNLVKTDSLLALSNILLFFCQPMLSIKAFAIDPIAPSGKVLLNFLYVFLLSLVAVLLIYFVSKGIFSFIKNPEERKKRDVLVFISTFSNCGFLGIPFVDMFTNGNSEAMMYVIIFNVAFNIIMWTLGIYLITGDKKQISVRRAFFNPSTVGSVIGFILFIVPQINIFNMASVSELQQIIVSTGNMTAPLSMLIAGVRLAELSPKQLFGEPKIYLAAVVRLILSFALTYVLFLPLKLTGVFADSPYVLIAPLIAMSMPPAASIVAFSERYNGDKSFTAAAFSLTTLLSILSLPIVLLLATL